MALFFDGLVFWLGELVLVYLLSVLKCIYLSDASDDLWAGTHGTDGRKKWKREGKGKEKGVF